MAYSRYVFDDDGAEVAILAPNQESADGMCFNTVGYHLPLLRVEELKTAYETTHRGRRDMVFLGESYNFEGNEDTGAEPVAGYFVTSLSGGEPYQVDVENLGNAHLVEEFTTKCDCGKEVKCWVVIGGGFIENPDFNLWGPNAVCAECDARMQGELARIERKNEDVNP